MQEILDDQIFFQQYNWTAALNEVMFASHEETLPQVEEPLTKHLTTTHSHSPQYSFFDTSNCTSDASLHRVVAERKRREKMSHRFVALSSLLPHLKKVLITPLNVLKTEPTRSIQVNSRFLIFRSGFVIFARWTRLLF